MKKIAILIENMYDEQELIYPYHRAREDYEVHLVGTEKDKEYKSKSGLVLKSTHASKDVDAKDYAGLIIPGGFSPDYMRKSQDTKDLVKAVYENGSPVAAICHGPWMLASSLDMKDVDVTTVPNIKDDLVNAGANWADKEVVNSNGIITSRTPDDLPAFMKEFLNAIK